VQRCTHFIPTQAIVPQQASAPVGTCPGHPPTPPPELLPLPLPDPELLELPLLDPELLGLPLLDPELLELPPLEPLSRPASLAPPLELLAPASAGGWLVAASGSAAESIW
jgi:hypothetical protein